MIRWQYVVTRLLIVSAVLLLFSLALGPVAQYLTITGLQSATGARVEIGSAKVHLFPPGVRYEDFRVADPRDAKAMRNAFHADSIELEIDGDALLHRRWVARHATVTGLQIGTNRSESGHFEDEDRESPSLSDKPSALTHLLSGVSNSVKEHATQAAENLETVRRSQEIKTKWEREYDALAAREKRLEEKIRELKSTAKGIDNPLRDLDRIGNTVGLAEETRAELNSILAALKQVPDQFNADVESLQQAKRIDLERVDRYVPGNLAESSNFGIDLVSQAVQEQVATLREYWEGGRTIAGYTIVAPENERARGVTIDLLGANRRPELLVRRCEVRGMMRADGNAYELKGVVENLTPSPELLAEPLRAQLTLDGPQLVNVDYIRDRRQGNDIDRLTLHWPQADAPDVELGDEGQAVVSIRGGDREVWVQMRSEGDQVEGRFVSRQTGVRLGLKTDSRFDALPATEALRESLAGVETVTIDAAFEGTWEDLSMSMDTNLGALLTDAAEHAIARQVEASKAKLAGEVENVFQAQQRDLVNWYSKKQIDAQALTAKADQLLMELSDKLLDGVDSSDFTIGRMNDFLNGRLR